MDSIYLHKLDYQRLLFRRKGLKVCWDDDGDGDGSGFFEGVAKLSVGCVGYRQLIVDDLHACYRGGKAEHSLM